MQYVKLTKRNHLASETVKPRKTSWRTRVLGVQATVTPVSSHCHSAAREQHWLSYANDRKSHCALLRLPNEEVFRQTASETYHRQPRIIPFGPMKTSLSIAMETNPASLNDWPVVLLWFCNIYGSFALNPVTSATEFGEFAFAKCALGDFLQIIRKESCCLEWEEESPGWALLYQPLDLPSTPTQECQNVA